MRVEIPARRTAACTLVERCAPRLVIAVTIALALASLVALRRRAMAHTYLRLRAVRRDELRLRLVAPLRFVPVFPLAIPG